MRSMFQPIRQSKDQRFKYDETYHADQCSSRGSDPPVCESPIQHPADTIESVTFVRHFCVACSFPNQN
jgi:hypothetical protein